MLHAGVWLVQVFCKTSQLNVCLMLHYYDVFKYRAALYKWTGLLSSFLQITGTLLKKFQISLKLNPSHWQPSLTTNLYFSGNGTRAKYWKIKPGADIFFKDLKKWGTSNILAEWQFKQLFACIRKVSFVERQSLLPREFAAAEVFIYQHSL